MNVEYLGNSDLLNLPKTAFLASNKDMAKVINPEGTVSTIEVDHDA